MHTVTQEQKELEEADTLELTTDLGANLAHKSKKNATSFKKGTSGNKAGRPKGSLNKQTLVKQAVLAETEGLILKDAPKVIKAVLRQAIEGCRQSQKLILDRIVPVTKAVDLSSIRGAEAPVIKIVVENLISEVKQIEIVDADYEEVE